MKANMTTMGAWLRRSASRSVGPGPRSLAYTLATSALALSLGTPVAASTLDLFATGEEVIIVGQRVTETQYHDEDEKHVDDFDLGSPSGETAEILHTADYFTLGTPFPPGLRAPLVSAAAQDDGTYGAGVSAGYVDPGFLHAEAALTYTYQNDGSSAEVYTPEFDIPVQSVGLSGYPSSHEDLQATSRIQILASTLDSSGVTTGTSVLAYSIGLRKVANPFNWTTEFNLNQGLLDTMDTLGLEPVFEKYYNKLPVGSSWVSKLSIPAYSVQLTSSPVQPGESLVLYLSASADVDVGQFGEEQGGEAFAGDPFNLMRSSGPTLFIDLSGNVTPDPSTLPLPASALLFIGGLALLGSFRQRRDPAV